MSSAAPDTLRLGFEQLLAELESSALEVALVPCRRPCNVGGCYRVAVNRNAAWYRRFCAVHLSSRKRNRALPDTRIKRANVLRVLGRLAAGLPSRSGYVPHLAQLAARVAPLEAVAV